jgi:Tfp pilus assembly protein FimV
VVAVLAVVAVVALRSAQGVPPTTSWSELAAASVADAAPVVEPGDHVITVTTGDTLWDIARQLAPDRDPRPLVAALTRANGGTVLQVGQRLVIPADLAVG